VARTSILLYSRPLYGQPSRQPRRATGIRPERPPSRITPSGRCIRHNVLFQFSFAIARHHATHRENLWGSLHGDLQIPAFLDQPHCGESLQSFLLGLAEIVPTWVSPRIGEPTKEVGKGPLERVRIGKRFHDLILRYGRPGRVNPAENQEPQGVTRPVRRELHDYRHSTIVLPPLNLSTRFGRGQLVDRSNDRCTSLTLCLTACLRRVRFNAALHRSAAARARWAGDWVFMGLSG